MKEHRRSVLLLSLLFNSVILEGDHCLQFYVTPIVSLSYYPLILKLSHVHPFLDGINIRAFFACVIILIR